MSNLIPFPVKIGEILTATATRSSIILGAARQVPINWEGNRAFLVNADIPSFQTALGQTKKTNEGAVNKIDLVTLTIPCDFRMTRQEIEAAKENGTYNELVATRLAENMSQMYRAIDYAIVHGYDLATGTKITTYDNVNGCLENAIGNKAIKANASALVNFGNATQGVEEFDPNLILCTPAQHTAVYTDENNKGNIPFNTHFDYLGIPTKKMTELKNKGVEGVTSFDIIAGDFSRLVWGMKPLSKGLEEVYDGNPRGKGELRDTNEVAFIYEIGIAWGITATNAFAGVKAKTEVVTP